MATRKQAKKRTRTSEKARLANKAVRTSMRSAVKKVLTAPSKEAAAQDLSTAVKKIDKAAKKGVIHANTAARQNTRLSRAVSARAS